MASLDDILARVAPKEVAGVAAQWEFDAAPSWLEVTGWFSPAHKLGRTGHGVRFISGRIPRTGDHAADITGAVNEIVSIATGCINPPAVTPEPVKGRAGRPKGSKNKAKTKRVRSTS